MMTWQMVVAGFLVVLCGYTLGAIFARVVCLTGDKVIAISIETALQNPGVAFRKPVQVGSFRHYRRPCECGDRA